MTVALPNPSSRLLRAAMAEQADLVRHRGRLTAERDRLLGDLREVDDALAATDRRLHVLAELAGQPPAGALDELASGSSPDAVAAARDVGQGDQAPDVLRGPTIRETAVRVLLAQPQPTDSLHYRRWYELLLEAGFSVAGKDPLAVFLTQLSRSPLVRKAATPGVYEVDRQASVRIRHRLERLQAELREVTGAARNPVELGTVRARRHELDLAITQQERALEEAMRVLPGGNGDAAGAASAG
jgi:hypothetical protein